MFKRNEAQRSGNPKGFDEKVKFNGRSNGFFNFDDSAKSRVWQRISRILSMQNPKPKSKPSQRQTFVKSRRIVRVTNVGATSFERLRNFENFISGVFYAK